jgi:two-component system sensor histidine kinase HydH
MSVILAIVVIGLAMMNYKRERQYMAKLLSEKGASLIRAFEAGARTGMMGEFGTSPRLDTLIRETAVQPDILYIAIVDSEGEILGHSDAGKIGQSFLDQKGMTSLNATKEVEWRTVGEKSIPAFEVYKLFLPVLPSPHHTQMMRMTQTNMGVWCEPEWTKGMQKERLLQPDNRPVIVIGMDTATYEEAIEEDIKLTVVLSGILFLLGMAGVVSLFWAQSYTRSKRLLSNISAISSEMINNLPEGVILTDSELRIYYINEIAATILGIEAKSAIGKNTDDMLPPTISSIPVSTARNGRVAEKEITIQQRDGKTIPVSVIATEVVAKDGAFVGQMYLLKDLSLIKHLQREIQKKDKLAALGNLAAGVAHEVRNPLSSIKGYASHFKNLFAEDSENRAAAEVLVNETDRLNRVITELLEIARPSDIKAKSVDIRSVIDATLRLIQPDSNQQTKTEISINIADDTKEVFIDPDRFVQVLMNIYLNSMQAMPDGGLLKTDVFAKNDHLVIVISDTGGGMSKETMSQLFNPYFTTKNTGTGLGMAIVQKIIDAHYGEITVSSEEGKGTVITIYLPH